MGCSHGECGITVACLQNGIATHFKITPGEFADALFVFDQENHFGAPRHSRHSTIVHLGRRALSFDAGQINFESATESRLTVDPNVASALFHDAVDRREAQPSSLSLVLGSEEWLEDMRLYFIGHAAARIGNCKHDVFAWRDDCRRVGDVSAYVYVGC